MQTWRDLAKPVIAALIKQHRNDPQALKKALFDAYPFGARKYQPYKVWCNEIRRQTGKTSRKKKGRWLQLALFD